MCIIKTIRIYIEYHHRKRRKPRPANVLDEEDDDDDRLQLPIASYFALIIGYCAIGSLLFNLFEKGPIW